MEYQQLTGEKWPANADAYTQALSPAARLAVQALLFSRASLPAPELFGLGSEQATTRVAALVGGKSGALGALWEARRAGMAVLMRERRYDLYVLPDEVRALMWTLGARELRTRKPPITFVVESTFTEGQFDEGGLEAAAGLLYDLAALIAFVRCEEAPLGPGGVLQRRAQQRLSEYLSVREPLPAAEPGGSAGTYPPRMGFLIELARRAGLVQPAGGEPERLQEGPMAAAWLHASPGRRLARILAAWSAQLSGTEVDALLAVDSARWLAVQGRGIWVKGFAEAVSHYEDEPFPAYRLVSLIRALQRLSWMGALFMWKVRWNEPPPESDQAGNVSTKPAPSQLRGLPPLANVAFALTSIGKILWEGLSRPRALLAAARLSSPGGDTEVPEEEPEGEPALPGSITTGMLSPEVGAGGDGVVFERRETPAADEPDLAARLGALLPPEENAGFIQPTFEILVPRQMRPLLLSRLLELCEPVRADRMIQLKLSMERVASCVRDGRWSPDEVFEVLQAASRHELPQNIRFSLEEVLHPLGRVQLFDGILLRADEASIADGLVEKARRMGLTSLERLTPQWLWIDRRHVGLLVKAAEAVGYPVRPWVRGTRIPYPVEKADEVTAAIDNAARQAARESGRLVERRPPPSLARGHRDLNFVPPGSEPELVASGRRRETPWAGRASGNGVDGHSGATVAPQGARGEGFGVQA